MEGRSPRNLQRWVIDRHRYAVILTELLAILSVSAAAGFRVALPLLLIGLLSGPTLWEQVPILSWVHPQLVVGVLVSWSLLELILTKDRLMRRLFPTVELILSPGVGAIAGIAIARTFGRGEPWAVPISGIVGGGLALVIQLVQLGWIYRLRVPPLWILFIQDFLCVCLVFFAFDAPKQGGLIALLLLWLALRTSNLWRQWYLQQAHPHQRHQPRQGRQDPD